MTEVARRTEGTGEERKDIVLTQRGLVPRTITELNRLAIALVRGGVAPKGMQPETALGVMLKGLEIGLGAIQSLEAIGCINGKFFLYGDGISAVLLRSGLLEGREHSVTGEGDDMVAVVKLKRKGIPQPFVGTFSWEDAKKANLTGKDTYKSYPKRMLFRRAMWFAAHDGFADVLAGLHGQEEVDDLEFTMPTPTVVDTTVVQEEPTASPRIAAPTAEVTTPTAAAHAKATVRPAPATPRTVEDAPPTDDSPAWEVPDEHIEAKIPAVSQNGTPKPETVVAEAPDKVAVISNEQAEMWHDWLGLRAKLGPDDLKRVRELSGVGKVLPSLNAESLARVITTAEAVLAEADAKKGAA
jgi:hypothetical protein